MMGRVWELWVERTNRPVDVRPLALVRIVLPLILLFDLMEVWRQGLLTPLWGLPELGGLGLGPPTWLTPLGSAGMPLLVSVLGLSLLLLAAGVFGRPAGLVAVLAYAALDDLFPLADRGIDRLIRTVLILLLCSRAHRCWTLGGLLGWKTEERTTAAWSVRALHLFLAVVYLSAGLAKLHGGDWFEFDQDPQLYRVLTDPMAGSLDPNTPLWKTLAPLFGLAGSITVLWELSSVVLLTRHAHRFALVGLVMHLGIACTMKLGIFAWAMLALYPVLLAPYLCPLFDRIDRVMLRRGGAPGSEPPLPQTAE